MIADEADEVLKLEEDPFQEEKLPKVLSEEPVLLEEKNKIKESKISIAVSNASKDALEINTMSDSGKEGVIRNKDSGVSPCEEGDNSHEVSLLLEDKDIA